MSVGIVVAALVIADEPIRLSLLWLGPLGVLTMATALGSTLLVAARSAHRRDISHLTPFFLQIWFFLSPITYPLSAVGGLVRTVAQWNPLGGLTETARAAALGGPLDWELLGRSVAVTGVVLIFSLYSFRVAERNITDVL